MTPAPDITRRRMFPFRLSRDELAVIARREVFHCFSIFERADILRVEEDPALRQLADVRIRCIMDSGAPEAPANLLTPTREDETAIGRFVDFSLAQKRFAYNLAMQLRYAPRPLYSLQ